MTTDPRVEAAAKAIYETQFRAAHHSAPTDRWDDLFPVWRERYQQDAAMVLAAADEADRVAGRITIDTNDAAMVEALDSARRLRVIVDNGGEYWPNYERVLAWDVLDALERLAALAAAGAQPPPKEQS